MGRFKESPATRPVDDEAISFVAGFWLFNCTFLVGLRFTRFRVVPRVKLLSIALSTNSCIAIPVDLGRISNKFKLGANLT
ncbi:hypothetical protein D9M71_783830 [compost metagenome]